MVLGLSEKDIRMNNLWILAEASPNNVATAPAPIVSQPVPQQETTTMTASPNAPATPATKPPPGPQWGSWALMIAVFVMLYLIMFRGPKKKQQQQKQMIESLKRNDRVMTVGGIIGTVVDVKGDEVTVKVDESTNTKIKFTTASISRILSEVKAKE